MRLNIFTNAILISSLFSLNAFAANTNLTFLNEYSLSSETKFQNLKFGGISGIVKVPNKNIYYAISDARNTKSEGMSRFYTLEIDTNDNGISQVNILKVTELTDKEGISYKEQEVDAEGIALVENGESIIWTSELGAPLRKSELNGKQINDFSNKIPSWYNAIGDLKKSPEGLRSGLAFEGVSITPSGKYLFIAAESALKQDGPISTTLNSSPARILKFALKPNGYVDKLIGEYVYNIDPIPKVTRFGVSDNGISDILAISDDRLLVVERSGHNVSEGFNDFDFKVKVYLSLFNEATNITGMKSIEEIHAKNLLQPVTKNILIDFDNYTKSPDGIEAITFGPLIKGKKSIILASDNNFQPHQANKFFIFLDENDVLN